MKAAKCTLKRLECLFYTVKKARMKLATDGGEKSLYYENLKLRLEEMQNDLEKYRSLLTGKRNPVVGVFGCPSRGKSTLLNVLLGMDILPMGSFIGTTRIGTVIFHQDSESDEPFTITARYEKDSVVETKNRTHIDVKKQVEIFSKQSNFEKPDIHEIEIEGPIRSYIGNNITFVDTPGAELGASKIDLEEYYKLDIDIEADTDRALNILSTVDVVIFCMRYDYKEAKDSELYNKRIKDLEPINVITHSESRNDGHTNEQMKLKLQEKYDLMQEHTVVLDSKKALDIINDPKNKNKNIVKIARKQFTGENLEGFLELKEKILRKIRNKNDKVINNRIEEFEDKYREFTEDAGKQGIELQKPLTDSEIKAIKKAERKASGNTKSAINHIGGFFSEMFSIIWKIIFFAVIFSVIICVIIYALIVFGII